MSRTIKLKRIVVAGDVTIDWNLARTRVADASGSQWNADDEVAIYRGLGGAALLSNLIETVVGGVSEPWAVLHHLPPPPPGSSLTDSKFVQSWAIWSLFPARVGSPVATVWRVEKFLGLERRPAGVVGPATKSSTDDGQADIVVLDDADLGFRDDPELWPAALRATNAAQRPRWIVLKTASPIAQGLLWKHLLEHFADRLIVLIAIDDLRLMDVQVSHEVSWERVAEELTWELLNNPSINSLSLCAAVIVSFFTAGAFLLSRTSKKAKPQTVNSTIRLFFDAAGMEDTWAKEHPGGVVGYTTCLAAGIVRELVAAVEQPQIRRGVQSGLGAARALHLRGYGVPGTRASAAALKFPTEEIVEHLRDVTPAFAEVQLPKTMVSTRDSATGGRPWTILETVRSEKLENVADAVALYSVEAVLSDVPLGRFGALVTVDRGEIESYRSIASLVGEYWHQERQTRPLCFAVFGSPGSGKSFGVTEVLRSVLADRISVLEFNLSQWQDPEELRQGFHRVRDAGVTGCLPLVFWDEFDAALHGQPLGWLPHFLAPMQDGCFYDSGITHPIGRAVFVFAGGTAETIGEFGHNLDLGEEQLRSAKVPDFVSRLKAYVDIRGINAHTANKQGDALDLYYLIRRAILLRALLLRYAPQLFHQEKDGKVLEIDRGVLRAFLQARQYRHGARSMEAIVGMSLLLGKTKFERSSLPTESQLDLHVDGKDFLALVHRIDLQGAVLEKLAGAAHEVFCEGRRRAGWRQGPRNDKAKKHPLLVPYNQLDEVYKESNRRMVRTIPMKLSAAGYVMVPAQGAMGIGRLTNSEIETVARMEHELWMKERIGRGFTTSRPTDDRPRRNTSIVDWGHLPERVKEIDRGLVRDIPKILSLAGYGIAKIGIAGSSLSEPD